MREYPCPVSDGPERLIRGMSAAPAVESTTYVHHQQEVFSTFAVLLSRRVICEALAQIAGMEVAVTESTLESNGDSKEEENERPRSSCISRLLRFRRRRERPANASVSSASTSPGGNIQGNIRQTISSWLRERSKYLNTNSDGVGVDSTSQSLRLRPWKKFCRSSQRSRIRRRELPPLPPLPEATAARVDEDDELATLTLQMENMAPGTAFLPEDDDDGGGSGEIVSGSSRSTSSYIMDFSKSLETVKNCGWYWGPISGDAAEKLLSEEPDGSFVVRDSSADHYIFSLTFKLNGAVRHVRIEHDQGNFSFGTFTKFKSNTIVDFIENAVEHSRSGRYLFFLHRRPVLGPMRVQLLNPVSRFKVVQSLQHQCRFVILRHVPRDLLHRLPVPPKIQEYLNTRDYY